MSAGGGGGRLAVAALLALLAGCAGQSGEFHALRDVEYQVTPWEFGGRDGSRVQSANYEIYTTVPDPRLIDTLATTMETAEAFYRHLLPAAGPPGGPMRVFLFGQRDEFEAFTRRAFGARANALLRVRQGGYSEQGVTVIEYVAHQTTFPVLTHEGFHQFVRLCTPGQIPAWLNEGLATVCEGQRWSRDQIRSFAPRYNPARRNRLADALLRDETFPLDELLRINAGNVIGDSRRRAATYYAQLWALMLFLMEDPAYAPGFERLLDTAAREELEPHARAAAISEGRYRFGPAVFRAFISTDLAAFERDFGDWMRRELLSAR